LRSRRAVVYHHGALRPQHRVEQQLHALRDSMTKGSMRS
jgi:hypothetical protein